MPSPEQIDASLNNVVQRIAASPLFHAALPFIAVAIVATEQKLPSARVFIGGALLLLTDAGKVISTVMAFIASAQSKPENKSK